MKRSLELLAIVALFASCTTKQKPTHTKKVTVVAIEAFRPPNTLQEYEVKYKVKLSDSSAITLTRAPRIGDTFEYRYFSR